MNPTIPELTVAHKLGGAVPKGYPSEWRAFYSPVDDAHGAMLELVRSATQSLTVCMFAFTDAELAAAVAAKIADPNVAVQITLDSNEAVYEASTLAAWASAPATKLVVLTHSEKNAYMHLKMLIVDGVWLLTGSTNATQSGEYKQDNVLIVARNRLVAAEAQARADAIHAYGLAHSKAVSVTDPEATVVSPIPSPITQAVVTAAVKVALKRRVADVAERAGKTFLQAFIGGFPTALVAQNLAMHQWRPLLSLAESAALAGLAAVLSLLTSLLSGFVGNAGSASALPMSLDPSTLPVIDVPPSALSSHAFTREFPEGTA